MNDEVFHEINKVFQRYEVLKEKCLSLYLSLEEVEDEFYNNPIQPDSEYLNYIEHKFDQIESFKNKKVDIERLVKIFNLFIERINRHIEYLDENTLRTSINLIDELHYNVWRTLERNELKQNKRGV